MKSKVIALIGAIGLAAVGGLVLFSSLSSKDEATVGGSTADAAVQILVASSDIAVGTGCHI